MAKEAELPEAAEKTAAGKTSALLGPTGRKLKPEAERSQRWDAKYHRNRRQLGLNTRLAMCARFGWPEECKVERNFYHKLWEHFNLEPAPPPEDEGAAAGAGASFVPTAAAAEPPPPPPSARGTAGASAAPASDAAAPPAPVTGQPPPRKRRTPMMAAAVAPASAAASADALAKAKP